MQLSIDISEKRYPLKQPFRISRGVKTEAVAVQVCISDGKHQGLGEATPYARYEETVEGTIALLEKADLVDPSALPAGAARSALDCALWDLKAKKTGQAVWQMLDLPEPKPAVTAFTISLGDAGTMANDAKAAANYPLLKLKLGGDDGDIDRLAAVRDARPDARLIVDANEGWTPALLDRLLPALDAVDLIEQPLPAGQDQNLPDGPLFCADESLHGLADLDSLPAGYGAVNIKLDKTGGVTEAAALAKAAQKRGLKIMLGCMVGSSLAMAPAMMLSGLADYIDLDGPLLLAKDHHPALRFDGAEIFPPPSALWG